MGPDFRRHGASLLPNRRLIVRSGPLGLFGLADSILLAELGPPADLARLFVMVVLPQFLGQTAAFEQLFEAAQCRTDRFTVMDAHTESHSSSLKDRVPG